MRYAVIEDGSVINVIEAGPGFTISGVALVPSDLAGPGWTYDGEFHPPIPGTQEPPEVIHAAYLRAALASVGKLDAVNALVASQGAVKQSLWDFATEISRNDRDVRSIADLLHIDLKDIYQRAAEIRDSRV